MRLLLNKLQHAVQRSAFEEFKKYWAKLMEYDLADEVDLAKILNTSYLDDNKAFLPLLVSIIQSGELEIVDHISQSCVGH